MKAKRPVRPIAPVPFMLCLVAALSLPPDARAGKATCAEFLTEAEVESALQLSVEATEPVEYSEGFTVCSWVKDRPQGQLGVNLSFFELKAIREGMVSAESIPEYFDLQVASKRGESGAEPQKLEGYGERAVLFSEEQLWIVMIQLKKGFAHLAVSPGDITRAQVEALAKAISTREKK